MRSLSRIFPTLSLIILMLLCASFLPVLERSTTIWHESPPDTLISQADDLQEVYSLARPHIETFLDISSGVIILDADDSREYTGIWVHGNGTLVLDGCKLTIREEDDGHVGEFNVTEDGTVHILDGSEVVVENGNFSVRGKEFFMTNSTLIVRNRTGGETGTPGGSGGEIDVKMGHNSTVEIITSEPVCILNSEICCLGQTGGTGGAGVFGEMENGGRGGDGGNAEIQIGAPDVEINGSTIHASGGMGGRGGEMAANNITEAEGGDGGNGGDAFLSIHSLKNITLIGSNFNSSGGCGGNASRTEGEELYLEGGRGGNSFTEFDALMSIVFEDCHLYSLRGDGGFGSERYMDGMWGKDDLHMEVWYNSIFGWNSLIRISKDRFNVLNLNPYGTNIFDNVSIFSREWFRMIPYGQNIIIKWPVFVRVLDDHTKLGILDVNVSIQEKNRYDEWVTIRSGLTDQKGYVRFYSITSRIMTGGDDLCRDETVRIVAKKNSYKVEMEPRFYWSIYVTMTLDTISLEIEDISYRSVLVNDSKLQRLNVEDVKSGWPLGGIIDLKGTAKIPNPTKTITKVEVSVNGMSASKVRDTSKSGNWSRWSYRLDTVRKTGNGTETKIDSIFDDEEIMLKFYAYYNNRYATVTEITLNIDQKEVNNPPIAAIARIGGIGIEELENQEIRIPPGKLKPIIFEGTLFDLDGNRVSNGKLWLKVVPLDAGNQGSNLIISNSENTEIDNLKGTWIVSWDLRDIDFQSGSYKISVDVSDGNLNSSDCDHFRNEPILVTIVLETRPSVSRIILDNRSIYEYMGGIYRDHGESSLFEINASAEPGVTIVEYHWTIRYSVNGTIIFRYNGSNSSLPFIFENLDHDQPFQEYIVDVYVTDSRGYDSSSMEFPVMVEPEVPKKETPDSKVGLTYVIVVGLLLLIIVTASVFFMLKRRGEGS